MDKLLCLDFLPFTLSCHVSVTATSELPAFLTSDGGLNSGFMMAHVTAAALGQSRQLAGSYHLSPF